jgi:hypothetical protein
MGSTSQQRSLASAAEGLQHENDEDRAIQNVAAIDFL